MKREDGHYWVKPRKEMQWLMAEYFGHRHGNPGFHVLKLDKYLHEDQIYKINEPRIKNPDEK